MTRLQSSVKDSQETLTLEKQKTEDLVKELQEVKGQMHQKELELKETYRQLRDNEYQVSSFLLTD